METGNPSSITIRKPARIPFPTRTRGSTRVNREITKCPILAMTGLKPDGRTCQKLGWVCHQEDNPVS